MYIILTTTTVVSASSESTIPDLSKQITCLTFHPVLYDERKKQFTQTSQSIKSVTYLKFVLN